MELNIASKGSKYLVQDKKARLLYTVKKKGFGTGQYNLMDASNYILYTLVQLTGDKKPSFSIILNDEVFLNVECKSMFLDPTITAEGNGMSYKLASKDRKNFDIILNDATVGHIKTKSAISGDLQYDLDIENTAFDDYIPLFAVAIDKAFGSINKQK